MRALTAVCCLLLCAFSAACTGGDDPSPPDAAMSGSGHPDPHPGPDARPAEHHACTGTTAACSDQLDPVSCATLDGCTRTDAECSGYAYDCFSFHSSFSCSEQPGCYWLYSTSDCHGLVDECSSVHSQASCANIEGCTFQPFECGGLAYSCGHYTSEATCGDQPGCHWQ
jgi:hypothetical protein